MMFKHDAFYSNYITLDTYILDFIYTLHVHVHSRVPWVVDIKGIVFFFFVFLKKKKQAVFGPIFIHLN